MDAIRDDLGAADADAPPAPGRRRVGQDGGRRVRPGGGRPGRASRARSWRRPTCSPASTSRRSAGCSTGSGIGVTLLTGSLPADTKAKATEAIRRAGAVVVGTHALIQEPSRSRPRPRRHRRAAPLRVTSGRGVPRPRPGRDRRAAPVRRGPARRSSRPRPAGASPHVLLMTATPIPRTLGQVLYADLDVSDLRTPPAGRVPIRTGIRRPGELDGTWQKVRDEAAAGHRTFVVVPLIEESGDEADGRGRRREPRPSASRRSSRRCGSAWSTAG